MKTKNTVKEWKNIHSRIKKAEGALAMYEMYIGHLFENYDAKTIFDHLEEKGVDSSIKWAVHKLLFNYDPDMASCLLDCAKAKRSLEIDRTDFAAIKTKNR